MKLIPEELQKRFDEVGDQSNSQNPLFITRFRNPMGAQSWYVYGYDEESEKLLCYVRGTYSDEWFWFSEKEIVIIKRLTGIEMKRDIDFKEIRFNELTRQPERKYRLVKTDLNEELEL